MPVGSAGAGQQEQKPVKDKPKGGFVCRERRWGEGRGRWCEGRPRMVEEKRRCFFVSSFFFSSFAPVAWDLDSFLVRSFPNSYGDALFWARSL